MQEDIKQIIFLQTHLNDNDNKLYLDLIKKLFGDKSNLFEMINVNKETKLENINNMSKFFNEFCMYYYVYKNGIYKNYDIISFGHYRRFINPFSIKIDEILNNKIQIYEMFLYFPYNDFGYINIDEIKEKYKDSYYYLYIYFYSLNYSKWVIDDMVDYFESQNIIPIENLKRNLSLKDNSKWYRFIARSMISINQPEFEKMMEFILGYFNYISLKYNFNIFNLKEMKKWYFDNIILDLRKQKIWEKIKNNDNISKPSKLRIMLFQPEEVYNKIYIDYDDPNNGLDTYCNCYRYFGYIFEMLVGISSQCLNNNILLINGLTRRKTFDYKGNIYKYQCNMI